MKCNKSLSIAHLTTYFVREPKILPAHPKLQVWSQRFELIRILRYIGKFSLSPFSSSQMNDSVSASFQVCFELSSIVARVTTRTISHSLSLGSKTIGTIIEINDTMTTTKCTRPMNMNDRQETNV